MTSGKTSCFFFKNDSSTTTPNVRLSSSNADARSYRGRMIVIRVLGFLNVIPSSCCLSNDAALLGAPHVNQTKNEHLPQPA